MNADLGEEVSLPFTPTNTARRSRIGYFGISGENFNDLWPLFAGVVCSVILGIAFVAGEIGSAATVVYRLALSAAPTVAAYAYLRIFVHERPPHFRGDLLSDLGSIRVNFTHPPRPLSAGWPQLEFNGFSPDASFQVRHPLIDSAHEG